MKPACKPADCRATPEILERIAGRTVLKQITWLEVAGRVLAGGKALGDVTPALPWMDAVAVYSHPAEPELPCWVVGAVKRGRGVAWYLGEVDEAVARNLVSQAA